MQYSMIVIIALVLNFANLNAFNLVYFKQYHPSSKVSKTTNIVKNNQIFMNRVYSENTKMSSGDILNKYIKNPREFFNDSKINALKIVTSIKTFLNNKIKLLIAFVLSISTSIKSTIYQTKKEVASKKLPSIDDLKKIIEIDEISKAKAYMNERMREVIPYFSRFSKLLSKPCHIIFYFDGIAQSNSK